MKYKECPECGAHLDPGEQRDCQKEKADIPDAPGMPTKDVNAIDENSLSNLFPNVNDCFRLREVRELTGVQAKDLSKLVQSRFPKFTRQIMSQCESYDKYGCLPHPDVIRIICDTYDIKLDNKPIRKGENYKRKLGKKVTLRMTEKDFAWLQSQVEHDDYPSVQAWLYARIKEWRNEPCSESPITQ